MIVRRRATKVSQQDKAVTCVLTVAGIIKEAAATVINEDMVDATVELKSCSIPFAVPVLEL